VHNFYKIIAFASLSLLLAYTALKLESSFADKFTENILALLTTLFAINIASSTLIAGKLREVQDKTGHEFTKTKKNLKLSFYEQIILIGIAFIFSLVRESIYLQDLVGCENCKFICNAILFFTFIYYLEIIRDLGKSLFDLLDFKNEN